ncbi:unnamed protein product, partial [Prorocentrum cordatum]
VRAVEANKAAWDQQGKKAVGAKSSDGDYASKWWNWTKSHNTFKKIWEREEDFKDSKITYNFLTKLGIYDEVIQLWKLRGNFRADGLNHRAATMNLRALCGTFESALPVIGQHACAAAVLAAIHFMVPLYPPTGDGLSVAGGQEAPWLFERSGPESMQKLEMLKTSLGGSAVFKKLVALRESLPGKVGELEEAAKDAEASYADVAPAASGSKDKKARKAVAKAKAVAEKARLKATAKLELPPELKGFRDRISIKSGSRPVNILEDHCFSVNAILSVTSEESRVGGALEKHVSTLRAISFNLLFKFVWQPPVNYRGKQIE